MSVVTADAPLRVGILGCSDIARRRFIPALLKSSHGSLAAVASRERETAAAWVSGTMAEAMEYQQLISAPHIDLVYISLPNHLHQEWSLKALQHGKHVLCEKPLGLSADQVNRMLDCADRHQRLLYENLMYLRHPQHALVKEIIAAGKIGRVRSLHAVFTIPALGDGNFRMKRESGGGAFHDLNRYPFSAALYFLKGEQYRLLRGTIEQQQGLDLAMAGETVTDAGEQFSFEIAFGKPYQSMYEISGESGSIKVERAFTTPPELENLVMLKIAGSEQNFSVAPADHFQATIDHVCRLIRGGEWGEHHRATRKLGALAEMISDGCRQESKG